MISAPTEERTPELGLSPQHLEKGYGAASRAEHMEARAASRNVMPMAQQATPALGVLAGMAVVRAQDRRSPRSKARGSLPATEAPSVEVTRRPSSMAVDVRVGQQRPTFDAGRCRAREPRREDRDADGCRHARPSQPDVNCSSATCVGASYDVSAAPSPRADNYWIRARLARTGHSALRVFAPSAGSRCPNPIASRCRTGSLARAEAAGGCRSLRMQGRYRQDLNDMRDGRHRKSHSWTPGAVIRQAQGRLRVTVHIFEGSRTRRDPSGPASRCVRARRPRQG